MIPHSYLKEVVKRHLGLSRTAAAWGGMNLDSEIAESTQTVLAKLIPSLTPPQANGVVQKTSLAPTAVTSGPSWADYYMDINDTELANSYLVVVDTGSNKHVVPVYPDFALSDVDASMRTFAGKVGGTIYLHWVESYPPSTVYAITLRSSPETNWYHETIFWKVVFLVVEDMLKKMGNDKFIVYSELANGY